MKIQGYFFYPLSSKFHRATLMIDGDDVVVYDEQLEPIKKLVIQSIQEPENIFFESGCYFKADEPIPTEIYVVAKNKIQLTIDWLEKFNVKKAVLMIAVLAICVIIFRFVFNSMSNFIVLVFPQKWERQIGEDLYQSSQIIFSDSTLPPNLQEVLRNGAREISVANLGRPVEIHFHSSKLLGPNALAFPGGPIVLTDELVRILGNREEVLAVIAHELAHIELRHSLEKILVVFGMSILPTLVFDISSGRDESVSSAIVLGITNFHSLRFNREFEKESDLLAVDFLKNVNINPVHLLNAIEHLFEYICDTSEIDWSSPCLDETSWFDTHPSGSERMQYLSERIYN